MKVKEILTKEYLYIEYLNKNKTHKEIAEQIGCSILIIQRYCSKFGLKKENYRRTKPENSILTKEFLEKEYVNNNKGYKQIATEYGLDTKTVYSRIRKYRLFYDRTCSIDPTKDKFNLLTPIEIVGQSKNGTFIWKCRCDCGKITNVTTSRLRGNNTKSCGCLKNPPGQQHQSWTGHQLISGQYWSSVRAGARHRRLGAIPFEIDIKYGWDIWEAQRGKCLFSGQDLILVDKHTRSKLNQQTASLDRIDSSKGYIKGNICWTHKDINRLKWQFSVEEFIKLCGNVCHAQNLKSSQISIPRTKSILNCFQGYITRIKMGATSRNIEFTIDRDYLIDIYEKCGGICYLSGLNLNLNWKKRNGGIDRIDSKCGYIKDNVAWCHKRINVMKLSHSVDYFREMCGMITQNFDFTILEKVKSYV